MFFAGLLVLLVEGRERGRAVVGGWRAFGELSVVRVQSEDLEAMVEVAGREV